MIVNIFLVVFFSIFGPKIGIIDLSLIGSLIAIISLVSRKPIIPKAFIVFYAFICIFTFYNAVMFLFHDSTDYYLLLRNVRVLISSFSLGLFFSNLPKSKILVTLKIIVVVLSFNAIVTILQVLDPNLQILLKDIYGFTKSLRSIRAFGLTAGYDTSGYLSIIGFLLTLFFIISSQRRIKWILLQLIFSISILFTSRSSMILFSFIFLAVTFFFFLQRGQGFKLLSVIYFAISSLAIIYFLLPIFLSTFTIFNDYFFWIPSSNYFVYYARTDMTEWQNSMWLFPGNIFDLIFGMSIDVPFSDVGFVKIVYMVGIIGLFIIIGLYGYILRNIWRVIKFSTDKNTILINWLFIIVLLIMILINIKNLYFFTRGFHELLTILFFTITLPVQRVFHRNNQN